MLLDHIFSLPNGFTWIVTNYFTRSWGSPVDILTKLRHKQKRDLGLIRDIGKKFFPSLSLLQGPIFCGLQEFFSGVKASLAWSWPLTSIQCSTPQYDFMLWLLNQARGKAMSLAVPRVRRLVAGLSPRRLGFDTEPFHVVFVADKLLLGQVSPLKHHFIMIFHSSTTDAL